MSTPDPHASTERPEKKGMPKGLLILLGCGGAFMLFTFVGGILAAIAIPNFVKFQCRAKQSQAKAQLKQGYVAQEMYRAEHNAYGTLDAIDFRPMGAKQQRYQFDVQLTSKTSFVMTARGIDDMDGDVWTINEKNELQNVNNRCMQ